MFSVFRCRAAPQLGDADGQVAQSWLPAPDAYPPWPALLNVL